MKKVLIITGIVAVLAVLVVVSAKQVARKGTKVYEEEAKKVDTLVSTVKASGEIEPKVYVNISSQVPGEIVDLRVKEGDRVHKGDILLQLDPDQYQSSVNRLEANLRLARINLEREKISLATYESTLRRQEALAKEKIVSEDALEQVRLQAETSRVQVQAYEEQIRQAEADLEKSRDELAKTTIRAPMDGLVTKVNAKLGEQVIIGTMNNPGTVILVLSDMSELLAEVRVDETEVTLVRPGQEAVVTVDALEDEQFDGTVTEIAHTAMKENDVSRFAVKVSLAPTPPAGSPPGAQELPVPVKTGRRTGLAALRPGMSAHAAIEVARKEGPIVVPIQAVIQRKRKDVDEALSGKEAGNAAGEGEGSIAAEPARTEPSTMKEQELGDQNVDVIFVDRDGKAVMIPVKTGMSDEFDVELVDAPIQAGDKVVVGPYRTLKKLKHGDAVVPVEKDEDLKEQT